MLPDSNLHALAIAQTRESVRSATSNISQASTEFSATTVLPAGHHRKLSLQELCQVIDEHHSMQQAEITAAEGYKEWAGTVLHRFLVLELHRPKRKSIWLRIDRRKAQDVGTFRLLVARGTTRANDTVSHPS